MKKINITISTLFLLLVICTLSIRCAKRATQATSNEIGKIEVDKNLLHELVNNDLKMEGALSDRARFQSEVIMSGDQISIVLYEKLPISQEKRSELKRVDETGSVFLLPIGPIKLEGLTLAKAEQKVEEKFSELVVAPHCEIQIVKKLYEPRVYVFGEVGKSGSVIYRQGDRLLDALSQVDGCSENAYKRSIKLIRYENDKINIYSINLLDIFESGNIYNNMHLKDRDIIFIPRRFITGFREVFSILSQIAPWYIIIQSSIR